MAPPDIGSRVNVRRIRRQPVRGATLIGQPDTDTGTVPVPASSFDELNPLQGPCHEAYEMFVRGDNL